MLKFFKIIPFFAWLLLCACGDSGREKSLDERERALAEKEQQFALKQQDYESLLRMRDSILAVKNGDSTPTAWPARIHGLWTSKLVCIASQCNEYVIGDQKTNEIWDFTNDSSRTLVAILNNKTLVRVYKGIYDSSTIRLHFTTDSLSKRPVTMNVLLDQISGESIKGTQTITIDTTCTAKFSVELSRIQK